MACCTFFGNRDANPSIENLTEVLKNLILQKGVRTFYVGNQGNFDRVVRNCLKKLKLQYPEICYSVVLAYMPQEKSKYGDIDFSDTIFPDGLEKVPPRYAIFKRNEWMLNKADVVVTFVQFHFGGAGTFKEKAQKSGKIVIELSE